jgi:hypothetical protein
MIMPPILSIIISFSIPKAGRKTKVVSHSTNPLDQALSGCIPLLYMSNRYTDMLSMEVDVSRHPHDVAKRTLP